MSPTFVSFLAESRVAFLFDASSLQSLHRVMYFSKTTVYDKEWHGHVCFCFIFPKLFF